VAFVNQCDSYFRRERIMEEEKVWLVSRNLEDDARVWFLQVQHDEGTPAWRRFTELLHLSFKSPPCPNLLHQVSLRVDNALRILADVSTQLDRLRARLHAKDKEEHERQAAERLHAAARGLLARRRAQAFHATKASKEQAAVRGFLVRRMVRMRRMFLIPARWQITAGWFDYSSSPVLPVAFQVWCLPATTMATQRPTPTAVQPVPRIAVAISSVQAPSGLVGCYILLFSTHAMVAVGSFPWDPGQHSCSPPLFHIFVLNNKGKPRCKRLNPRSRPIGLRQLSSSRKSWVSKSGGDVMGSQRLG